MKESWLVWAGAVVLVGGVCVGCSDSDPETEGTGGVGGVGAGGAGGVVPDSGSLLNSEPVAVLGMKMWTVRYASRAIDGTPIEVTGMVAAPEGALEDGVRDVVSYAHGTTGVSDPCTPSLDPAASYFALIARSAVEAGYVAVATDYEGLGTEGLHPYYVRESAGRGVVDIVLAARELEEARAGSRVVVWGNSQGGHAALSAGEVASAGWAPDIEIVGVVSWAPGSELPTVFEDGVGSGGARGFLWQMVLGFTEVYAQLSLEDIFEPAALETCLGLVEDEECNAVFLVTAAPWENAGFKTNPVDIPEWLEALEENTPGNVRSEMPILLMHGTEDSVVPPRYSDALFERLCGTGSATDYRVLEGAAHSNFDENMAAVLDWTAARFAGEAAADSCP